MFDEFRIDVKKDVDDINQTYWSMNISLVDSNEILGKLNFAMKKRVSL